MTDKSKSDYQPGPVSSPPCSMHEVDPVYMGIPASGHEDETLNGDVSEMRGESPLWSRVMVISEAIDDPTIPIGHIRGLLCGLDEGFAGTFDPVEDFPEFAAHRLCRSFERFLARLDKPDPA